MNTLTPEQIQLVASSSGKVVRLTDPQTNQAYVLIKEEDFARLKQSIGFDGDQELSMAQVGRLMEEAMRDEDEEDPLLESYQNYKRKA